MALIALPNLSDWDTDQKYENQSSSAKDYYIQVESEQPEVLVTQEECGEAGSGIFRCVRKTNTDTNNNLRIVKERAYTFGTMHPKCFHVSEHKRFIEQF